MNRDDVIGFGLLLLALIPFVLGILLDRMVLIAMGGVIGVVNLPASYKLIRYEAERVSLPGEIVADMRRSTNGRLASGMLVSLSGIDGAGKSTIGEHVVEELRGRGIPATRIWGRWEPRLSYPLMGLLYVTLRWRRKDYHRSRILRRWWGYLVLADQLLFATLRLYPRLVRGDVVIVDRWIADQLVELRYDGLENRRVTRLLEHWLPTPSAAYYLDVPVEVAQARKSDTQRMLDRLHIEEDADTYLRHRRELFESAADSLDLVRLETMGSVDETVEEVVDGILDEFYGLG